MPSKNSKYRNVSLPEPLLDRVKLLIEKHPDKGFISVSDFVRQATIRELERHEE